ncbi:MAG: efflux transporter, family, subunit [Acidimicrobiales bacterium]|nr:efflux transporter, family, subunit [Acidimicrobiales bacterium]
MRRRRRLAPWAVVPLAVLLGAGGWFAFGRTGKASPASSATTIERTVDVTSGPLTLSVSASGTIAAAATADLSFTSSGTVTAVTVKAGDSVKKGAVLATLDSAQLASGVTAAAASVADAQAKLASDTTAAATAAQLDADRSNLAAVQAQLLTATAALDAAKLVSPIDGTVATVDLTAGQQLGGSGTSGTGITGTGTGSGQSSSTLGSGSGGGGSGGAGGQSGGSAAASSTTGTSTTGQVQVVSTGAYVVKLNVDDTDIARVKVGQQGTIRLASANAGGLGRFGRGQAGTAAPGGAAGGATTTTQPSAAPGAASSVTGFVTSVGTVASATSGVATFPVDVLFSGSPATYHVGATAQVDLTYDTIANTIQVPAQAVTRTNGADTVVVITKGKKQTRQVRTGITTNGLVQVTSGLKAGEQVVVSITAGGRPTGGTGGTGGGGAGPPGGFVPGGGTPGGFGQGGRPGG